MIYSIKFGYRNLRYQDFRLQYISMSSLLPAEIIENRIYVFRGQKVMIDRDLSNLYGVEIKRLNESVQRNIKRFPEDFAFKMTKEEFKIWKSQFATSKYKHLRKLPTLFTEPGIAMLSSVLNSEKAIAVNIQIIRTFIYLRDTAIKHSDLRLRLDHLEKQYDEQFKIVFDALRQTIDENSNKGEIGFKDTSK
jgi:hypothetical protein